MDSRSAIRGIWHSLFRRHDAKLEPHPGLGKEWVAYPPREIPAVIKGFLKPGAKGFANSEDQLLNLAYHVNYPPVLWWQDEDRKP